MKYKVKIAILSFLTLFLSVLNLKNGLVFNVTDNTERDAFFSSYEEKTEKKDTVKANLNSVNTPKAKATIAKTTAKTAKKSTSTSSKNSITINGKTVSIVSGSVLKDKVQTPKNTAAKYQKMIYGHNTTSIFSSLKNLKKGSTFTVTTNGKTEKYQVVGSETLTFDTANKNAGLLYNATYKKYLYGSYDLTLMTCAGKDLGNGKATHRLVVFAKKI